jgi:flagellum-specific peptidoglycan hydrolase FlgJ
MTEEQKGFIEKIGKIAAETMKRSGINASLVIAQAILESGWGKSGLTKNANALFGIKASAGWKGRVYSAETKECYDGVNFTKITALFRAYDNWEESINDHTALLIGASRYRAVIGEKDYRIACLAVHDAGYATDPAYASKLINLIERHGLEKYDKNALHGSAVKLSLDGKANMIIAERVKGHWMVDLPGVCNLRVRLADVLSSAGYMKIEWDAPTATVVAKSM